MSLRLVFESTEFRGEPMAIAVSGPGPAKDITERSLTELGDKLLKSRGYEIVPSASDAVNPRSGYPQKVYVKPGRMLIIEYTKTGGKLSDEQQEWAEVINSIAQASDGAVVYLNVEPSNWDELRKAAD